MMFQLGNSEVITAAEGDEIVFHGPFRGNMLKCVGGRGEILFDFGKEISVNKGDTFTVRTKEILNVR